MQTLDTEHAQVHFDAQSYNEQVAKLIPETQKQLERAIKPYVYISSGFAILTLLEFFLIALLFPTLAESAMLAVCLAAFFFTLFSYFVTRLYLQARQPEQLAALRDQYMATCKVIIGYQEGISQHHMALAHGATRLANTLTDTEYDYYSPPRWLDLLEPTMRRFSCWWHWYDVHAMKELLFYFAINEQIKVVQLEPTSLEVHAALANTYVMLSTLYSDPRKAEDFDHSRWIPSEKLSERMQESFRRSAQCAIEEFQILNEYAPNDPWVHSQLAYSYHDLQMPEEEIKEYETILRLRPEDKETLFKLGLLYFQLGHNARGLRIYEQLRQSHYKKAESLIKFYGGNTAPS